MTDTQLLEKQATLYAKLPDQQRAILLKDCKNFAFGNYPADTVEFNRALLPMLERVESAIQASAKPAPPTAKETRACLLWLGGILGGAGALIGGLYIAGAIVVGIGEAVKIWAVANAGIIGWVIASGLAILAIGALPKPEFKSEIKEPETASNNQTIIVNVFTSQNGNVDVKN